MEAHARKRPHPTGVVSFRAAGWDCEELARRWELGVALRAGLHCAPLAHRTAGTLDTGTARLSLSDFHTPAQLEKLAQELHQLFRETVR
ncbi:MAG: aminotransferase class V-fold PLP-dependent enzyme [Oscillospiraceae bacterium]